MSEKKSTFGLTLDQLADLLAVGMEQIDIGDGNNPGHPLTDQLQDILTHPLFQESGLLDSVQVAMDLQGRDMDLLADRSLGEVLLDPDTDLELLQILKSYFKKLYYSADSEVKSALTITLYHGTLANSLVHHGQNISQNSPEMLDQSFALLIEKEWMAAELTKLFLQARRICQDQRGTIWETIKKTRRANEVI